jgi:hypothetical protein
MLKMTSEIAPDCCIGRTMRYDKRRDEFTVRLRSGATIIVPRRLIPGFDRATPRQLEGARLSPDGAGIIVNDEIDYAVVGLLRLISGDNEQRRIAGRVKSAKKAAAVRENGKKGGRPRKVDAA